MSAAAMPLGEQLANLAESDHTHKFVGSIDGGAGFVTFYLNTNTNTFSCNATIDGRPAKMVGELLKRDDGKYDCYPKFGVNPDSESGDWENTEDQEVKTIDINGTQIDFEGAVLTKA